MASHPHFQVAATQISCRTGTAIVANAPPANPNDDSANGLVARQVLELEALSPVNAGSRPLPLGVGLGLPAIEMICTPPRHVSVLSHLSVADSPPLLLVSSFDESTDLRTLSC
jgi:hypothetical protein